MKLMVSIAMLVLATNTFAWTLTREVTPAKPPAQYGPVPGTETKDTMEYPTNSTPTRKPSTPCPTKGSCAISK